MWKIINQIIIDRVLSTQFLVIILNELNICCKSLIIFFGIAVTNSLSFVSSVAVYCNYIHFSFHVGTLRKDPTSYSHAIALSHDVLQV